MLRRVHRVVPLAVVLISAVLALPVLAGTTGKLTGKVINEKREALAGVNIRIEFIVNRLDELQPPAQPTGSQLTAARLVVPVAGFMGMLQHFNTLVGNLKAPGRLAYRANPDAADLRSTPLIVSIVTPQ